MKHYFILAAIAALAVARPELYKEQEDFQYSRSSSDEGSKSGYYDAQRGNMGGNYERAHNMDALAQNQMSGLVNQVEGELGDGAMTRSGNVYSAAKSKGIYGSGRFDLSNLAGRNFHEGTYYDNSHSHSSSAQSSSTLNRNEHSSSNSRSNYRGYQRSDAQTQTGDLQTLDDSLGQSQYYNHGRHSSGFQSHAGFQEHGEYDHSDANLHSGYGSNIHTRLISATPVRIILTPGGRVAIPVVAQTYDATHGSSAYDQNAQHSDAAVITDNYQGSLNGPSDDKHYESSYKYHKKWEKHDTVPTSISVAIPTERPIPTNSELLEDSEAHSLYNTRGTQNERLGSASSRYSGVKSSSSQSQYQSNYNSQHRSDLSNSNLNAFTQAGHSSSGANHGISSDLLSLSDLNNQVENLSTRPKSYQSSYSYHKSWERQGDPYIIKPASSGDYNSQASQRLTSPTKNQGYSDHYQSGSRYYENQADCDENGHIRIARSTNKQHMQQESQSFDDVDELVQQVQNTWQNLEDVNQQSQDIRNQQNVGQQSQTKWDTLEDLNQQIQNNWEQKSQDQLVNIEGYHQESKLDQANTEQQSENNWKNDLSQQLQNNLDQQPQNQFVNFEGFNQQSSNLEHSIVEQQSDNKWNNLDNLSQQSQNNWIKPPVPQTSQNKLDNLEDLGQQSQTNWEQQNVGQESDSNWERFENLNQQSQKAEQSMDQATWTRFEGSTQQQQNSNNNLQNHRKQGQNFLEGLDQDIGMGQIEVESQLVANKTETESYSLAEKKHNDKRPHKIESPWDKFDILDANNKNISNIEHKSENNDFYWHHISNNGVDDQQINKLNANGDIISELESHTQHFNINQNSEQTHESVGFSHHNNPNIHYSYSNGFVNPTVYDKRNLNHDYQNPYQVYDANTYIYNLNKNRDSQAYWREHVKDSDSSSQVNHLDIESHTDNPKMLSSWSKFDKIEKQSIFSKNDMNDFTQLHLYSQNSKYTPHQLENSSGQINKHNLSTDDSTYFSQNHKNLTSKNLEVQMMSEEKIEHTTSKLNKEILNNLDLPNEAKIFDSEMPEKQNDIGRGDIGADDFFSKTNESDTLPTSYNISDNKTLGNKTLPIIKHNNIEDHGSHNQFNVLNLEQQSEKQKENNQNTMIKNQINRTNLLSTVQNQLYQTDRTETIFRQDIGAVTQQNHAINKENRGTSLQVDRIKKLEQHDIPDIVQDENFEHGSHNFEQSSHNFEQSSHNFEQSSVQDFTNVNKNFHQQNLHNFEQENIQDFVQQNENFEQMNLHNFDQENIQDFVQQNENFEQTDLHNFEQENVQDFVQKDKNFDQEYLHTFVKPIENEEQHNLDNFKQEGLTQHTDNFESQILHNFSEQGIQTSGEKMENLTKFNHFEQNIPSYGRENNNQHGIQQENLNNLWSTNEQFSKQNTRDFSQFNIADYGIQTDSLEQKNLRNIENNTQNEKLEHLSKSDEIIQHNLINELQTKIIEEHSTERLNVTENAKLSELATPLEPVTEKPGFWKSLGNKFSNAKNTVVTWFKS